MLDERDGRVVDALGWRGEIGGLSSKALVSGSGRWVRMREAKEALGLSVLRALRESMERLRVGIMGGIVEGSWARVLVGEKLGGGVGGRFIRRGFRRGIWKGETSVESVLFCDAVEASGLWSPRTVPVLLLLSLLLFLASLTGRVPRLFAGLAMVFSNENESDAKDESTLSLPSGETGLCRGVNERIDEVTVLGDGETSPNASSCSVLSQSMVITLIDGSKVPQLR